MKKLSKALGTLLALCFAGAVGATPLSLLFAGGSLTVGDKLFDNWGLRGQGLIDTTGQVDLSQINVTGSVSGSDVVLRFDTNGQLSLTGDNLIDLYFGYRVSVLPGSGMAISGVAFDFLQGSWSGDGLHAGTEDIFDVMSNPLGSIDLEASTQLFQVTGSVAFNPVSEIFVQKNILLNGFALGDGSRLDSFSQTFTQSQVPVPSTAWLLLAAGVGWFEVRRRQLPRRPRSRTIPR